MGLQKEVWIRDIQEQLYAANPFLNFSVNHNEFITDKTVHVPLAGTAPNVEINRSVLPAGITQRADSELTYNLNEFTTDPMLITDIDEIQTSYNKRQSVLGHHINEVAEKIALQSMVDWAAPAANVIKTTGSNASVRPVGASGDRKAVTLADIRSIAAFFDRNNIPRNGRYIAMPSDLYYQLIADNTVLNAETMGTPNLPSGIVRQLYGINIIARSETVIYDNADAVKAVGAASATTDSFGCIAWQEGFVARAMGATKVYADIDKPEYYGSIFSTATMHGTSKLRTSGLGTVALVQGQ